MSAQGGTPEAFTTLDASRHESSHRLPEILPRGQAVVFTVKTDDALSWDDARIEAVSLRTRQRSVLITGGTNARYAGGHLIYVRAGALWAATFDPVRLEVAGPSVLVLEGVSSSAGYGSADFGVSRDGSLVYVPGKLRGSDRRLVRVNRAGKARPLMDSRRAFSSLSLSPDGRRLALTIEAANDQIWVYDLERSTLSPQTLQWNNNYAIWTPDGSRLTFGSTRARPLWNLFWQPADGSGPPERLTTSANVQGAQAWSPDGKTLVFLEQGPTSDVWILPLDGDRKPRPFLHGPFNESQATDRAGPGGGARKRRPAPRPQAREHPSRSRRPGQAARLRSGQGGPGGRARLAGPHAVVARKRPGSGRGDSPIHEPRAGSGPRGRSPHRRVGLRLRALRDAERKAGVRGRDLLGRGGGGPGSRAGLAGVAGGDASRGAQAAPALSPEGEGQAPARRRRRAAGARGGPGGTGSGRW